MIVHPGSNVGVVIGYGDTPVGGLSFSNFPSPGDAVSGLSNTTTISPTLAELNGP